MSRRSLLQKLGEPQLFDIYPNGIYGFSFFRLKSSYSGDIVWVKRSSDSTVQTFGLVGNSVDTSAILSFVGAGNGVVTRWYNQGSYLGYVAPTVGNEPLIVSSGTLVTDNGLVAIDTAGGGKTMIFQFLGVADRYLPAIYSGFVVAQMPSTNNLSIIASDASSGVFNFRKSFANINFRETGTQPSFAIPYSSGVQLLLSCVRYTSNLEAYKNNTSYGSQAMNIGWGSREIMIGESEKKYQEIIYFSDDKRTDAAAIQNNRNAVWGVF